MNIRIQLPRNSHNDWKQSNPILLDGEIVIAYNVDGRINDTRIKIGDGINKFNDLPWETDSDKLDTVTAGIVSGVATLDNDGRIPLSQIPPELLRLFGIDAPTPTSVPYQENALTYNGSVQSMQNNAILLANDSYNVSGTLEAVNAGKYRVSFTPTAGNVWEDGTTETKHSDWVINRVAIYDLPEQSNKLTYNGSSQFPTWNNYDSEKLEIIEIDTSATNAGTYSVGFIPTDNYKWYDDTTDVKYFTWHIDKVDSVIRCSKESLTFVTADSESQLVDISTNSSPDNLSITISNPSVIDAALNESKQLTVSPKAIGSSNVKIVISNKDNTNYNYTDIYIPVYVKDPTSCTVSEIITSIENSNNIKNIYSIGDKIPFLLNGTCRSLTFNNDEYKFSLLGFNHNKPIENSDIINNNDTVTYQLIESPYSSNLNPISLCDTNYNKLNAANSFSISASNWEESSLRNNTCREFLNCLPVDIRNLILDTYKYTDTKFITDKIFILSEYEMLGRTVYSDISNAEYQKQYEYYMNGNSVIRYNSTSPYDTSMYWERCIDSTNTDSFCAIDTNGNASYMNVNRSLGFIPTFVVCYKYGII